MHHNQTAAIFGAQLNSGRYIRACAQVATFLCHRRGNPLARTRRTISRQPHSLHDGWTTNVPGFLGQDLTVPALHTRSVLGCTTVCNYQDISTAQRLSAANSSFANPDTQGQRCTKTPPAPRPASGSGCATSACASRGWTATPARPPSSPPSSPAQPPGPCLVSALLQPHTRTLCWSCSVQGVA